MNEPLNLLQPKAEKCKKSRRAYQKKNRKKIRESKRRWEKANQAKRKIARRIRCLRKYNFTLESYDQMIKKQGGLCALCHLPLDLTINNHIDHDHKCCKGEKESCGKCIRGILHSHCNRFLAYLERYPELVDPGRKYLENASINRQLMLI